MNKRIIALALLLCTALLTAVSCADNGGGNLPDSSGTAVTSDTSASETTEAETEHVSYLSANLPATDFNGYEFRIQTPAASYEWWLLDVDEQNGEVFNDAIFKRNATIEEVYNVKIVNSLSDSTSKFSTDVKNAVASGDDIFDAIFGPMNYLNPLMLEEMLIDLYTVDYFDFDAQWWDQNFVDSFTLGGKLFFASGSISPIVDLRSYVMVFSKTLADNISYEYPYQAVLDGKWTNEYFSKYIKGVNADLNGDGQMNYDDRWGYLSENQASAMLALAFDAHVVEKNSDGMLEVTLLEERNITRLSAALELLIDKETTILANPIVQANSNSWAAASEWFCNGGALIRSVCFEDVPQDYRNTDVDFGIVPFPKYDEAQETYRTCVAQSGSIIGLPVTVSDPDRSGFILEAMAAESVETIIPAFYDICLTGKYVRDEESADMLDIIIENKIYDLGYIFGIGGFRSTLTTMEINGNSDVVSAITAIEGKMHDDLEKQMAIYSK